MTHFYNRYYPTVCVRRAEVRALSKLPLEEKAKTLPIVLLAPWLNSIAFENTTEVVGKCIGDIPVIVDVDRYFRSSSDLPSRLKWREFLDPEDGHIAWMQLIQDNSRYIPCIQIHGRPEHQINYQVGRSLELGRGLVFRFELQRSYNYDLVFSIISSLKGQDYLCVFDAGYGDPTEIAEQRVSFFIEKLIGLDEGAKFVVTGSNFPNDFSQYDDFAASKQIGSRMMFGNLLRKYGNYQMYYGDWASTKPRKYDGGGSKPLPRIDYPTKSRWIIARSKENDWDFEEASRRIVRLPEWTERPLVWGTGMIEKTAMGLPGGISTGPEAIACRINIHLFLQTNYNSSEPLPPPQGKWIDPI